MGYGLTGFHEASHSKFGIKAEELLGITKDKRKGFLSDDTESFYNDAFRFINKIREELNNAGLFTPYIYDYGRRLRYRSNTFNGKQVQTFDSDKGTGQVYIEEER